MDQAKVARDLMAEAQRLDAEAARLIADLQEKAARFRKAAEILVPSSNGSIKPPGSASGDSGTLSDKIAKAATGKHRTIPELCAATGLNRKQVTRTLFKDKKKYHKQIRPTENRPEFKYRPEVSSETLQKSA